MARRKAIEGFQRGRTWFDRNLWSCTCCHPHGDLPEVEQIGRLFWYSTSQPAGPHRHDDLWEIGFFPDGHRGYRHGDQLLAIPAGGAVISPPGTIHGEGPLRGPIQEMRWFTLRWPSSGQLPGMTRADGRDLRKRLQSAAALGPLPMTDTWPRDFYHLLCILASQAPYVRIKARSLLHALLCMLIDGAQKVEAGEVPRAAHADPDLDPALALIRAGVADPPSLGELAAACGLSERRFRTRFQQAHGMSPSDLQLRERLLAAMHAMEDPAISIADAARVAGFASAQSFATAFKRLCQVTPSGWRWHQYRKMHRDDPIDPSDREEFEAEHPSS